MSLREQLKTMRDTACRLALNIPALVERGHWDESTGALLVQRYRSIRNEVDSFIELCESTGRLTRITSELYRRAIERR